MRACVKCRALFDSRNCPECHRRMNRVSAKNFRINNPDRKKEIDAKYRLENKSKIDLRIKRWRSENKDKVRNILKRYRHSHKMAFVVYTQNRRAKIRKDGGKLSPGIITKLYESQKGLCACCKQALGDKYHLDHRMPIALGGRHEDSNMQLLTQHCNSTKWAKHPDEHQRALGKL